MSELQIPDKWRDAFAWVEETVGGRLVSIEAHPRWRPAWYLEVERDGERLPLYWRGARTEWGADIEPLEREGKIMEVLEAHGVSVPHCYGLHLDPPGLLMDRCPGAPPDIRAAASRADGEAIIDQYLEELARIHAIPVAEFAGAGLRPRANGAESCLGETPSMEARYRAMKNEPDPMIEFLVKWVRRNVPRDRERQTLVLCDSGQFLWEGNRVTALLDFELAYIGDPAADLAGLRTRDLSEPLGDLRRAIAKYGEITGEQVDTAAVDYHTVRFSLSTPLSVADLCTQPGIFLNYAQYLAWYLVYGRFALEVLAHLQGIPLEAPQLPEVPRTRRSAAAGHLVELLDPVRAGAEGERAYDLDRAYRVAQYLERAERYGPALEADNLGEAARLLGHQPADRIRAEAELERFVLDAGPERDAEIVPFLWRRIMREESLLKPAMRELENVQMPVID